MRWKKSKQSGKVTSTKETENANKVNKGAGLRLSVGLKLFIIIFLSIVCSVGVTGFVTLSVSNNIIETNSEQSAYETIQQISEKVDSILGVYEQIVMQILTNINMHESLYTATDENRQIFDQLSAQKEISETLNQIAYSNSMINNISIIPVEPDAMAFTTGATTGLNIDRELAWFQQAIQHQNNTWLHTLVGGYSNLDQRPVFGLSRLMRTNYGQSYVILLEIHESLLTEQVAGIQLSDSSRVYIVNANNQLLHADNHDLLLTEAEIALPEDGHGIVQGADGVDYIVVSQHSEKADWHVIGVAPVHELTKDTQLIQQAMLYIVIAAAIAAVLLSILVARSMGGPLRRLQRLMMEGAKGNLNVRTNFKNRDEIGQVGQSFNEMMEQIKGLVQQTNQSATDVLSTAQNLSVSANDTAHAAREISEATEQIANGASTLASEAERGNELVLDLSQQLNQVVMANRSMGEVASDVHKVSEQGTGYMVQLTDKTQATEQMTSRMLEKVDQLKESTASIRNLLDMLTQITQQTNILALNASIEASRSGSAGRGFMVIAGEIRNLADESRRSIDVVAEMTDHIQGGIDETVSVMQEAYPLFQEQIAAVKDADTIFNNVRERMIGLVQQSDEVTESIELLEKAQHVLSDTMSSVSAVSEQSSAISEEVASSSASQLNTSESLVTLVGQLETLSSALTESLKKFKV